ncbi:MAG: glycosyl transferase family 2 [Geobacteraceae bacterium GWC2_58_44]|nr:MAG: glycosyl transferase family 2 [Geobacteraceae bacterium GWC2_58_44]HBG06006.1 glycosyl transferase family 2 [Geobacter sp.]
MTPTEKIPVVTVVVPCYNLGAFIRESVESVLNQSLRDVEIVIVDDGSDDPKTGTILDQLEAGGLTVLRTANCGVAAARNRGIEAARGRYILPLDADDLIEPSFLEKAVLILEANPEVGIVGCDAELFQAASGVRRLPGFSRERLLSENLIFASALFRKSQWQEAGGYCTSFRFGWEDWDFWISMTRGGCQVVRIPEPLLKYRIRPDSRDRSMAPWQKGAMLLLIVARHFYSYLGSPANLFTLFANAAAKKR